MRKTVFFDAVFIIVVSLAAVFALSYFVPFNMDEFYQYNILPGFFQPDSAYNVFHESPFAYYLAPFGNLYMPIRAYHYTGSIQAFFYLPLYLAWPSPYSARFFGLIMLGIQAFLLSGIFRIRPSVFFIILLAFMPYAFSHIVDTGPVSLQTTSVFLIYFILVKWRDNIKNGHVGYAPIYLVALVLFLNLWAKFTFFYYLPAVIILILFFLCGVRGYLFDRRHIASFLKSAIVSVVIFAIPSFILLNSTDRSYYRYWLQLFRKDSSLPLTAGMIRDHAAEMFSFLTNPIKCTHRIYEIKEYISPEGILLLSGLVIFIYICIVSARRSKKSVTEPILNAGLFAFVYVLTAIHVKTWAIHHVILAFPFLIMSVAGFSLNAGKRTVIIFGLFFILVNAFLYCRLPFMAPMKSEHRSKAELNAFINEKYSKDHAVIVVDWGFYFLKSVYGDKNQCIIYANPFKTRDQVGSLRTVLELSGRKPLFVLRLESESDLSLIRSEFPGLTEEKTDFDTGDWRIWL